MSKYVGSDLHLQPRRNHAGYTSASARPDDMFGATIPGLTVELELKAPSLIDACKNIASIYLSRHGVKYRVYQLEVQPAAKRSHNEPGNTLYGPHQHIGDCALEYDHSKVSCSTPIDDFLGYSAQKRTSLSPGRSSFHDTELRMVAPKLRI